MNIRKPLFTHLLRLTLIVFAVPGFIQAGDSEKAPNVLFIIADDLSSALSGFGHPQSLTPNLDRLAQRGTSFTRAYSQFPLCGPSRASIMTGLYPLTNGVVGNRDMLNVKTPTLPELFKNSGYWSGRVSKIYHMGVPGHIFSGDNGSDHADSWHERYNVSVMESLTPGIVEDVMLVDSTPVFEEYREKWYAQRHQGGRFYIHHGNHQGNDFVIIETDVEDEELADGAATHKAIKLLKERANNDTPFFLGVGFVRPHAPFVAPKRSFKPFVADEMLLPEVPEGDLEDIPIVAQRHTNAANYKLTLEAQRKGLRGYYASIHYMDEQVGRLLDTLEKLDLADDTIIVFMSDHGYHLGEHTMWQKHSLMEESARAPLIISAPGQKQSNRKSDALIEFVDIYPTIAELAGLKAPDAIQGKSFAHLLDNPEAASKRNDAITQVHSHFSLRTERWALMRYVNEDGPNEYMLYDMEKDPQQFTNLADKPEYADILKELETRLDARIAEAKKAKYLQIETQTNTH